jgi:hypothetical protein
MPSLTISESLIVLAQSQGDEAFTANQVFMAATGWSCSKFLPKETGALTGHAADPDHVRSAEDMFEALRNVPRGSKQTGIMLSAT